MEIGEALEYLIKECPEVILEKREIQLVLAGKVQQVIDEERKTEAKIANLLENYPDESNPNYKE